MIHKVKTNDIIGVLEIDDAVDESLIRYKMPLFFRTPHGKRETIEVYRGGLIVRATFFNGVENGRNSYVRRTKLYLYADNFQGKPYLYSVKNHPDTIPLVKKFIDKILADGKLDQE